MEDLYLNSSHEVGIVSGIHFLKDLPLDFLAVLPFCLYRLQDLNLGSQALLHKHLLELAGER